MSDSETSMAKMRHSEPDDQSFDDVQEEWLNEDVLSDDEFNTLDHDSTEQNESLNMDLGLVSDDASLTAKHLEEDVKKDLSEKIDTIDEYLDQFMDDDKETQMESWQTGKEPVQNSTSAVGLDDDKHSDDSTDELLRVLGEDEKTSIPKLTVVKSAKSVVEVKEMMSSEDEIFEGAKIRTVKLSKNVLMKKSAPEVKHETSDSEISDNKLMRRIFRPTKKLQKAAKSTTKSSLPQKPGTVARRVTGSPQSGLSQKPSVPAPPKVTSAPRKPVTVVKKRSRTATVQKPVTTTAAASARKATPVPTKLEPEAVKIEKDLKPVVQKLGTYKNMVVADEKSLKMLLEKSEDEESWDDENLEYLDGEFDEETSDEEAVKKMKVSNDDTAFDHDSEDSDYSFYEGMPTSESEDIEECFELDIRAERAADYVPMLGGAAHKLLTGEKNRVTMKLNELRKVLAQITENVKEQTTEIDAARKKLRELNMQLNHT